MNYYVRSATHDDLVPLIELRKLLLSKGTGHYAAQTPEEDLAWQTSYSDWLIKNVTRNPNINVIVTCAETTPSSIFACAIGIVDERVPFKGCLNGRMGWVQTVVVLPEYRRLGMAERMMSYLFDWFRSNEVAKVTLQTTSIAQPLYKKLEFYDSEERLLIKNLL